MTKVPLNQTYKRSKTYEDYPEIKTTFDELYEFAVFNNQFRTNKDSVTGEMVVNPIGRIYDQSVIYNAIGNWTDKVVCELGARDGIFCSYLTNYVKDIYVSDYFQEWGKGTENDLGQIERWEKIWKSCSPNPDRLHVETQNITELRYCNDSFDVVIATGVMQHLHPQCKGFADIIAIREMVRICKPGGFIALSLEMGVTSKWVSGTYYYSLDDVNKRIIKPSGCKLLGESNFEIEHIDNDAITEHNGFKPVTSAVFILQKKVEDN